MHDIHVRYINKQMDTVVFSEDLKYVTIEGVKYIRCWKTGRERTLPPKCRKQYMVSYRIRKKQEFADLKVIVKENKMRTLLNSEVTCAMNLDTRI